MHGYTNNKVMLQLSDFVLFTFMYCGYMILVAYVYYFTFEFRILCVNEDSLLKY